MLLLIGLVLGPAVGVVAGGLLLGWLGRRQGLPDRGGDVFGNIGDSPDGEADLMSSGAASMLWAVPFAGLSAVMVLAPVVAAVLSVMGGRADLGYLMTIGFGGGALVLDRLAARDIQRRWLRMRVPGVVLSAAVGFFIALASFLGSELASFAGYDLGNNARVLVPLGVAVLLGALGVVAWRRRRDR